MQTKLINIKKRSDLIGIEGYVYIGRAGHGEDGYFGNPVVRGRKCPICGFVHQQPAATLPCYEKYFYNRIKTDPEFKSRVEGLRGKILGCFCVPGKDCHGRIIIEYLRSIESATNNNNQDLFF